MLKVTRAFREFVPLILSLCITTALVRIYEYIAVASKVFTDAPYKFELLGLLYDVWLALAASAVFFIPFILVYFLSRRLALVIAHLLNVVLLLCYIALIITFSQRNTPFDHELFTRAFSETLLTTRQMISSGFRVFIPFVIYVLLYFIFYWRVFKNKKHTKQTIVVVGSLVVFAVAFIGFANPAPARFQQIGGYYLTCNKLSYFIVDSYKYFIKKNSFDINDVQGEELKKQIDFYQYNQPFHFTSKAYPLLHLNDEPDVLGSFFNLQATPPNIVILVVEGLSSDFSGQHAYAASFTPFLDSLATKSLSWENFLSTAPGTFAAHPAITGSLPYGKKGFSIMNVMPEHLSVIKILRKNNYQANFMIGFNPDFDNMGGYIRLQGTDFILNDYPAKYKQMGVGSEGWSMGYPDDAMFERSFAVMDSMKMNKPYLNIYHTATTHMPYLFEQKPLYEKRFDQKLKTLKISKKIRKTLQQTKEVITTFMFSDDCIRKFFSDYGKRPEYNNTIFFITGDHHIGSFPTTCEVDEYHVPLIIYSPMLKAPRKFLSVNSHNNIAPTITQLLVKNYPLNYAPKEVHWLGDVLDTAVAFRNIHSMPFMSWNRDIDDYLYKDYFLSGDQLYKLAPNLLLTPIHNEPIRDHITQLRENFKIINAYVCEKNKVFPAGENLLPGTRELLQEFSIGNEQLIRTGRSDTSLTNIFTVPKNYKYLYVEATADALTNDASAAENLSLRFGLVNKSNWDFVYYSKHDMVALSKTEFVPGKWNSISVNDLFPLGDFVHIKNLVFETALYCEKPPINIRLNKINVKIYGIK